MYLIIKRTADVFFSMLLLIVLSPLFFIISLMIKLNSKGRIIFKQDRVGKNGKLFKIYKFRTMVENNGKEILTFKQDKRMTFIGRSLRKSRLDELPQLVNVLKGEMSFIGPRPEIPELVKYYNSKQKKVLEIKPGITGLSQIEYGDRDLKNFKGKNIVKFHRDVLIPKKMKYDLYYRKNLSFSLDLNIFLKTIAKTISII